MSNPKIKYAKQRTGEIFYPRTIAEAIRFADGESLETKVRLGKVGGVKEEELEQLKLDIDNEYGGTVEITSEDPVKSKTVLTINPEGDEVHLYTAEEVDEFLEVLGVTTSNKISEHNVSEESHGDIRLFISELNTRLNAVANSEDVDLDQLSELVAYIKSNRTLIESITTSKVSVTDIIDNLTTSVSNKPLSAKQGVLLKALIDAIIIPTKTSQLMNDSNFVTKEVTDKLSEEKVDEQTFTEHANNSNIHVTASEKQAWNNKLNADQLPDAINNALATAKASGQFNGADGKDGKDYVLTNSDKSEIAEMVEDATIVQAPLYVNSTDKMTDTSRVYVLAETGHIWAYMDTTVTKEVTVRDDIVGTTDNPFETGRLSSSGALSNDVTTHHLTPYIHINKPEYQGKTIQIHLDGCHYASSESETYIMCGTYDENKNTINGRSFTMEQTGGMFSAGVVKVNGENSATITLDIPYSQSSKTVGYIRFCGMGAKENANVYITYQGMQTVTGGQWVDTGTTYAPTLTEADKAEMVDEIVSMVDTQLLDLLG